MDTLLQGIPGVCVYIDDILVSGQSEEEHLIHLSEALSSLVNVGMRLKRSVAFCYHQLSTWVMSLAQKD